MKGDKKPGPKEERVKLDGDWEQLMKKAVDLPKPPEGWPKRDVKPRGKKKK